MTSTRIPLPGFADPVHDAQAVFRLLLDAVSKPARPVTVPALATAVGALTPTAAAIALSLCDEQTPLWLDPGLATDPDVLAWFAFHTGSPIVPNMDMDAAAFAFVSSPQALPPYTAFNAGDDEAPHLSTTIVISFTPATDTADPSEQLLASGPGFREPLSWTPARFPEGFLTERTAAAKRFPRGIDLLLAGTDAVTALPRTTALTAAAPRPEGER